MAKVVLTYDIDDKHKEFKKALKKLGYVDQIGGSTNLPNTTMYHSDKTAQSARDNARATATALKVDLERCLAIEIATWAGIIGDAHVE